jgi:hypothetical protein
MLIALLAILGVDLIVIGCRAATPTACARSGSAVRAAGSATSWSGAGPLMFGSELVPADCLPGDHPGHGGGVKRLGGGGRLRADIGSAAGMSRVTAEPKIVYGRAQHEQAG